MSPKPIKLTTVTLISDNAGPVINITGKKIIKKTKVLFMYFILNEIYHIRLNV